MTFDSDFMNHVGLYPHTWSIPLKLDSVRMMNKISSQSDPLQALALVASLASNDTESLNPTLQGTVDTVTLNFTPSKMSN
jgi:hypothetical protein